MSDDNTPEEDDDTPEEVTLEVQDGNLGAESDFPEE